MALGFNQAGLLFATSRKSTVERKAMGIANDKISLSRESQALSEDYSRQQNLRKLVWEDKNGVQNDIAFNTITTPFSTGNSNYIMTNIGGKMVVDSAMMVKFGLKEDTGFLTMSRNAFLAQFDNPFVPGSKIDPTMFKPKGLTIDGSSYQNLKLQTAITKPVIKDLGSLMTSLNDRFPPDAFGYRMVEGNNDGDANKWDLAFKEAYGDAATAISLIDPIIASLQASMTQISPSGYAPSSANQDYNQWKQCEKELKELEKLKKSFNIVKAIAGDTSASCSNKLFAIGALFIGDQTIGGMEGHSHSAAGGDKKDGGEHVIDDAEFIAKILNEVGGGNFQVKTNGTFWGDDTLSKVGDANTIWDGGSGNIGWNSGAGNNAIKKYQASALAQLTTWESDLISPTYNDGDVSNVTLKDYVDYYDSVWKHLTYKGWIKEERVNDPKFLENSLRSGGIYIEKQAGGYSFSRIAWQTDASCALRDVRDKTGVNLAQIDYERKKSQLDQKEGMMDVEMRNLDMERAALEAQIDTLKSVITKNVERSFKMFQA